MEKTKKIVWEYVQSILLAVALALFIIAFVVQSFIVTGPSMEPTLYSGERLLINKFIFRFTEPARGDIVVFHPQARPKEDYIKRVISVAGETVEIRDGGVWIDGLQLTESYVKEITYGQFGPVKVPEGKIFVLGDNRNNSQDSRYNEVGLVSKQSIVGKAILRYWPLHRLKLFTRKG
ncbi:MAG: signal peptidase I [Firmicutes bacterium]|nr:signal peptidase I [Bacillota bacterium]